MATTKKATVHPTDAEMRKDERDVPPTGQPAKVLRLTSRAKSPKTAKAKAGKKAAAKPAEKPKHQPKGAELSGIEATAVVIAPAGTTLRLYAFGHRRREKGVGGVARLLIDGQPKGGFTEKGPAIAWARERFGSLEAAKDWARNEPSKGTLLVGRYTDWAKTLIGEVELA
jgi:hypothetical protein